MEELQFFIKKNNKNKEVSMFSPIFNLRSYLSNISQNVRSNVYIKKISSPVSFIYQAAAKALASLSAAFKSKALACCNYFNHKFRKVKNKKPAPNNGKELQTTSKGTGNNDSKKNLDQPNPNNQSQPFTTAIQNKLTALSVGSVVQQFCGPKEICALAQTSKFLTKSSESDTAWKVLGIKLLGKNLVPSSSIKSQVKTFYEWTFNEQEFQMICFAQHRQSCRGSSYAAYELWQACLCMLKGNPSEFQSEKHLGHGVHVRNFSDAISAIKYYLSKNSVIRRQIHYLIEQDKYEIEAKIPNKREELTIDLYKEFESGGIKVIMTAGEVGKGLEKLLTRLCKVARKNSIDIDA